MQLSCSIETLEFIHMYTKEKKNRFNRARRKSCPPRTSKNQRLPKTHVCMHVCVYIYLYIYQKQFLNFWRSFFELSSDFVKLGIHKTKLNFFEIYCFLLINIKENMCLIFWEKLTIQFKKNIWKLIMKVDGSCVR